MASAQVLPNAAGSSRKQGHLEAGKRRLQEFRKNKAAAKKAASTSQSCSADSTEIRKQVSENGQARINPVGAAADERTDAAKTSFPHHNDKHGFMPDDGPKSVPSTHVHSQSHHVSFDLQQMKPKQEGNSSDISNMKSETAFVYPRETDVQVGHVGPTGEGRYADGIPSSNADVDDSNSYYYSNFYCAGESVSNIYVTSSESLQNMNGPIKDAADQFDSVQPTVNLQAFAPFHGQHRDLELENNLTSGLKERNSINAAGSLSSFYYHQGSDQIIASSNSDVSDSYNGALYSAVAQTRPRRFRTSFIDSLNISRDSPAPSWTNSEQENLMNSKSQSSNFVASSAMQDSFAASAAVEPPPKPASPLSVNYFGNVSGEEKLFGGLESKLESIWQKQHEDFAALEQHIEDLTQEKFSLQRALDASKSLSESLASENSSLTESYNQQASIVTQLKAEMERLQGEIKAQVVELESIKAEYMNVQLECNAADERAKLLASEVIGLEEKALRLRSNELKLERELENSSADIASYKKKMSSLEKEHQDLLQTVDALQEEKKLLQSKLRRASAGGISVDVNHGHANQDASTCTNDLGLENGEANRDSPEQVPSDLPEHDDADNLLLLAMQRPGGDSATTIPPDQVQMILNINSLISEIRAEKDELVEALVTERSTRTKLKDLNKELSQKLEAQIQRLELLTAQSMASENIPASQPAGPRIAQETVAYADEGDEVVERVLGWIMKLFPGGPLKRRTSRL